MFSLQNMKLFLVLACTVNTAVAVLEGNELWPSGSILQARQLNDFLHLPRSSPIQRRESYVGLLPRSNVLQHRSDQPQRSGSSRGQGSPRGQELPRLPDSIVSRPSSGSQNPSQPARHGSPTIKSSALAQGPASLKVGSGENARTREVPLGQNDAMHDAHAQFSMAKAESRRPPPRDGHRPPTQVLEAGAKGQSVSALVQPGEKGKGRIRVETPAGVEDTTFRNAEGKYEAAGSSVPGGARVMAKSYRGGKVTVFAADQDTTPRGR